MFFLERDRAVQNVLMLGMQADFRDFGDQVGFHAKHLGRFGGNPGAALDTHTKVLSSQPVAAKAGSAVGFLRKVNLPCFLIALMRAPLAPEIEVSNIVRMKYK